MEWKDKINFLSSEKIFYFYVYKGMQIFIYFFIGTIFGSFFGLVIDRWDTSESIIFGRSRCEGCQTTLKARDLIPVFSQLVSKSRCRYCQVRIPLRYMGIELATGLVIMSWGAGWISLIQGLTLILSLILSIFDIKIHSFPFIIWLMFAGLFLFIQLPTGYHLIWLILAGIAQLKDIKIGAGDFLWFYLVSFSCSLTELTWIVLIASGVGIIASLIKKEQELPFLPYLSIGYLVILLWDQIL